MICRQCQPWNPTGNMDLEQAIQHLVEVHSGRAVAFLLKLRVDPDSGRDVIDFDAELGRALAHRSEYNNTYGVYE